MFSKILSFLLKNKIIHGLSVLSILLSGCDKPVANEESDAVKSLDFAIQIDTLMVSPSQSSQLGSFFVADEFLYYVDKLYGIVEKFDASGNQLARCLQVMNGPEELMTISEVIPYPKGFIVRSEWEFYFYDRNWVYERKIRLDTNEGVSFDELLNQPKANHAAIYELQNYDQKTSYFNEQLLVKLDVEHPQFNGFSTRAYYKEASILGLVELTTGKLSLIPQARPASYDQYSYIPFHIFFDYDLSDKQVIVTFEPDPSIYRFDTDFNLLGSFGQEGQDMQTSYPQTNRIETAFDNSLFSDSRSKDGFYKYIFVDGDRVFRTYRQGSNSADLNTEEKNPLRMQLYTKEALANDIGVPSRFRIIGKIGDTYFADGYYNEQDEEQGLYRLKVK